MNDRELLELAAKAANTKERHGLNKSAEHVAWVSMRQRCSNPNKKEYKHYGGRGIKVCTQWSYFTNFLADIGLRPSPRHSVDRIDVNGDYEPGNVRWATQQEQIENTTVIRRVTIGAKTQSISAWEREMGLSQGQVKGRESNGWTTESAILTPSVKGQKLHMRRVATGYTKLKNGTFRVNVGGQYIRTVAKESDAIELVAATRRAAEIGKSKEPTK